MKMEKGSGRLENAMTGLILYVAREVEDEESLQGINIMGSQAY